LEIKRVLVILVRNAYGRFFPVDFHRIEQPLVQYRQAEQQSGIYDLIETFIVVRMSHKAICFTPTLTSGMWTTIFARSSAQSVFARSAAVLKELREVEK